MAGNDSRRTAPRSVRPPSVKGIRIQRIERMQTDRFSAGTPSLNEPGLRGTAPDDGGVPSGRYPSLLSLREDVFPARSDPPPSVPSAQSASYHPDGSRLPDPYARLRDAPCALLIALMADR